MTITYYAIPELVDGYNLRECGTCTAIITTVSEHAHTQWHYQLEKVITQLGIATNTKLIVQGDEQPLGKAFHVNPNAPTTHVDLITETTIQDNIRPLNSLGQPITGWHHPMGSPCYITDCVDNDHVNDPTIRART